MGTKEKCSDNDIFTCRDLSSHVMKSYRSFFVNLITLDISLTFIRTILTYFILFFNTYPKLYLH